MNADVIVPEGEMLVTCWCARSEVSMPIQDVAEGKTMSCGKRTCDPDQGWYPWRELFRKQPTRSAVQRK